MTDAAIGFVVGALCTNLAWIIIIHVTCVAAERRARKWTK